MAYRPENYLNYDLIIECPCCNDLRFEEDSKVHCKEPPSSSQTPAKPYIYTTEMSDEHTTYALSQGRKASWNTSLYLQYRYEVKHPERNAFKPPPEESTEVKNGYRKWAHYVRCNYEVKDNLLHKKYRAKPSKLIPTQGNILHYISDAHMQTMHGGIKATYKKLSETVTGITRDDVQWLLERCHSCVYNKPNKHKPPLRPLVSSKVLERIQIDVMDFTDDPSGEYKWVLNIKDDFSRFTRLYPLVSKEAAGVARCLREYISYYNEPQILQCDNGLEFKGEVTQVLKDFKIRRIFGRPRWPQSQGSVERSNGIVKNKIKKWKQYTGRSDWASGLDEIAKGMNSSPCRSHPKSMTPYTVFFNFRSTEAKENPPLDSASSQSGAITFQAHDAPTNVKVTMNKIGNLNSGSHFQSVKCKCKGSCRSNRCACFKAKVQCSQHCGHMCENYESIAQGTQQSIIRKPQCVVVDSQTEAVDPIDLSSENENENEQNE